MEMEKKKSCEKKTRGRIYEDDVMHEDKIFERKDSNAAGS